MHGRTQVIILVLAAVVATALLVAWTAGLLDLGNGDDGDVLLEHEWRATGIEAEPELHEVSLPFEVASDVGRIRISYRLDLPSDLATGLPGSAGDPSPEVRLELLDGSGTVVWQDVSYGSAQAAEDVDVTVAGGWTLHVWARGYGYEGEAGLGTPVEFHDALDVAVESL